MPDQDTPRGSTPGESARRTHGIAADIPPTAESSPPEVAGSAVDGDGTAREAAGWRRKLRAAEAERDALAGRVEGMQRTQIEAQVSALGIRPAALWASGVAVSDLLTDGEVDAQLVRDAVAATREQFGIAAPKPPTASGLYSGLSGRQLDSLPHPWAAAFSPRTE